jgi:DNA anti-recombination protein RmuC
VPVSDEAIDRVGALLEQLGSRFELVLEAVSGYGARLDALREEIFGQFTEVGRQIRFLSEQIAENRDALAGVRSDLGAEIVRLGETLGATRVDFREQLGALRQALQNEMGVRAAQARDQLSEEVSRRAEAVRVQLGQEIDGLRESLRSDGSKRVPAATRDGVDRAIGEATAQLKTEVVGAAESVTKKLSAELKQTNKAVADLARKFERFDDRITIQSRDQEQRVRKLERGGGGRKAG